MNRIYKKILFFLFSLNGALVINVSAIDSSVEIIDSSAFKSATPTAMQHFCAIKDFVTILWDAIQKEGQKSKSSVCSTNSIEDFRSHGIESSWATAQGLFLIVRDSIPLCLMTPWGEIKLVEYKQIALSLKSWKSILDNVSTVISVFHSGKYAPKSYKGFSLDMYEILSINHRQLPRAIQCNKNNMISLSDSKKIWSELDSMYNELKNI